MLLVTWCTTGLRGGTLVIEAGVTTDFTGVLGGVLEGLGVGRKVTWVEGKMLRIFGGDGFSTVAVLNINISGRTCNIDRKELII